MISIGIDASTSCTGVAVFDDKELIKYGAIKPKGADWRERLANESITLAKILNKYKPEVLYIEDVPRKPGSNTLVKLGAVHGMILCLCAGYKLTPTFLLPSDWRRDLGMYDGTREGTHRDVLKEKAVKMANEVFGLSLVWAGTTSKKSDDDIAEAVLIAWSQIVKSQNHS